MKKLILIFAFIAFTFNAFAQEHLNLNKILTIKVTDDMVRNGCYSCLNNTKGNKQFVVVLKEKQSQWKSVVVHQFTPTNFNCGPLADQRENMSNSRQNPLQLLFKYKGQYYAIAGNFVSSDLYDKIAAKVLQEKQNHKKEQEQVTNKSIAIANKIAELLNETDNVQDFQKEFKEVIEDENNPESSKKRKEFFYKCVNLKKMTLEIWNLKDSSNGFKPETVIRIINENSTIPIYGE